jgi:hypothetical protein
MRPKAVQLSVARPSFTSVDLPAELPAARDLESVISADNEIALLEYCRQRIGQSEAVC